MYGGMLAKKRKGSLLLSMYLLWYMYILIYLVSECWYFHFPTFCLMYFHTPSLAHAWIDSHGEYSYLHVCIFKHLHIWGLHLTIEEAFEGFQKSQTKSFYVESQISNEKFTFWKLLPRQGCLVLHRHHVQPAQIGAWMMMITVMQTWGLL